MTAALRHVRLGVRADPRRSDGREHDLHAGPRTSTCRATPARRSRRCAACTAIITGCGSIRRIRRCSTTSTTAASISRPTPARHGSSRWRPAGRSSTTWRSTPARRHGRTDRSRTSAAAAASIDLSHGPRPDPGGRVDRRARRRGIEPRHRSGATRTSSTRTGSTETSRADGHRRCSRAPAAPPAAAAASAGGATAIATTDPAAGERRAARAVDGADHHLAARSGHDLRGLPVRLSARRIAATLGDDQPGPDRQRSRRRCCSGAPARFRTRRSSRSPNRRRRRACSMPAPTTAGCT